MFMVDGIQAVEPEHLGRRDGILVTVDEPSDSMGFPTVMVAAESREALLSYIHDEWSAEVDEEWFAEYIVGRVHTLDNTFEGLRKVWESEDPRNA
jgi:hypothetical protein